MDDHSRTPTISGPQTHKKIRVTVAFPIAPGGPFHETVAGETLVGTLRQNAMQHFGVAEDSQHAYYLTHEGVRSPEEATVGSIAEHHEAVKFTLVKELVQG